MRTRESDACFSWYTRCNTYGKSFVTDASSLRRKSLFQSVWCNVTCFRRDYFLTWLFQDILTKKKMGSKRTQCFCKQSESDETSWPGAVTHMFLYFLYVFFKCIESWIMFQRRHQWKNEAELMGLFCHKVVPTGGEQTDMWPHMNKLELTVKEAEN